MDLAFPVSVATLGGLGVTALVVRTGARTIRAAVVVAATAVGVQIYNEPSVANEWIDKAQDGLIAGLSEVFPTRDEGEVEDLVDRGATTVGEWFSEEHRDELFDQIVDGTSRLDSLRDGHISDKGPGSWGGLIGGTDNSPADP